MAEQYVHTLIPNSRDFVPDAAQVHTFLRALVDQGVVPAPQQITLWVPTSEARTIVNPFTRQPMVWPVFSHEELAAVDDVPHVAAALSDYRITLEGQGRPTNPPLPIAFDEAYQIAVTVRVSSVLCSTSES